MSKDKPMLKIYILEDNSDYLNFLKDDLTKFIMIEELPIKIVFTSTSSAEMLKQIKDKKLDNSIFLLDIEIDDSSTSGVDVAEYIRKKSLFTDIIFITSHPEAALLILTHKIAPFDLINKSLSPDDTSKRLRTDIKQIIKRTNTRKTSSQNLFSYSINSQVFAVPLDDVLYIQTVADDPGNLELHSQNEIATFHNTLNHLESKYPSLFRCHKSILVNPKHIKRFNPSERYIYMDNGEQINVSFRKVKNLRNLLNKN